VRTQFFVEVLRDAGRPRSAFALLDDAGAHRNGVELGELLEALWLAGEDSDAARLVRGLGGGDADRGATRLGELSRSVSSDVFAKALRSLTAEAPAIVVSIARALLTAQSTLCESVLRAFVEERTPADIGALIDASGDSPPLTTLVVQLILEHTPEERRFDVVQAMMARGRSADQVAGIFVNSATGNSRRIPGDWVGALRKAGPVDVNVLLAFSEGSRWVGLAKLLVDLHVEGEREEAQALVRRTLAKHTGVELHYALHEHGSSAETILFDELRAQGSQVAYVAAVLRDSGYTVCANRLQNR
jgi:hypothetical protein